MIRPPPRSTLFPTTTLFRSGAASHAGAEVFARAAEHDDAAAGHVFAAVVADTFDYCERARVAHGEAFAGAAIDRKSTRLNSSHANISYAVFCLKKKTPYFIS